MENKIEAKENLQAETVSSNTNLEAAQKKEKKKKKKKKKLSKKQKKELQADLAVSDQEFKKIKKTYKKLKFRDDKAFMNMLRSTNKNHYTLNQMVDRKARIMLSVNALILSLIIGKILTNHEMHDYKFFILVLFGVACFISIVYAMLAMKPEKSHGKLTEQSIRQKKGNPLFFGNFKNMPLDDYENTMMRMVNDRDFIYRSMIQDIYFLGQVLEEKRQYLSKSIFIFVIGLTSSLLLSFAIRLVLTIVEVPS